MTTVVEAQGEGSSSEEPSPGGSPSFSSPRDRLRHGYRHHRHHHGHHHERRRHLPVVLVIIAVLVSIAIVIPLLFLLVQAGQVGWASLDRLLFRHLTGTLLWNTISLTVVVTVLAAIIGTVSAWFVERTKLPGRSFWAVAVVIPLGIPDFVVSFGWHSLFPALAGFWAAVLVMTLAVYPLVYLPVAASLRNADPAQEEVARSLGLGRYKTFWRVTVGQARLAILGGAVLVGLVVLAEFGSFEILGFNTLTTEVFTEYTVGFNQPAACAFSLILVLLGAMLLFGESAARGRGRTARMGSGAARRSRPRPLGRTTPLVLGGLGLLVFLALGVPVGEIIHLLIQGGASTYPTASLLGATGYTFLYSASAGLLATAGALPIALLSVRHSRRPVRILERSNMIILAVPGLVIALGFTYLTNHYLDSRFYQTPVLLVVTYAVMFFPMAVVSVRAAVARSPLGLEEVGSSLGVPKIVVFWRVTLPLIGPGLAAAFCLVFLEAATELTATLVLIPTSAQTLATQFWNYQQNISYSLAARPAAMLVLIAAVPSYVLGRWFDRLPSRTSTGGPAPGPAPGPTPSTMVPL